MKDKRILSRGYKNNNGNWELGVSEEQAERDLLREEKKHENELEVIEFKDNSIKDSRDYGVVRYVDDMMRIKKLREQGIPFHNIMDTTKKGYDYKEGIDVLDKVYSKNTTKGCGKFLFYHMRKPVYCGEYSCGFQLCPECSEKESEVETKKGYEK